MKYYMFDDCNCKFPIMNNHIQFDPHMENIPLDCNRTWNLICNGNTKGIFQLDSRLGKKLSKELKPNNIKHLSALISIMRPGCLASRIDDKSITQHYIDRKNGIENAVCFHPSLENILKDTYQLLIYQEQAIKIGVELAGMSLSLSDELIRKGIGKKKPELIAKAKKSFIKGCKKLNKVDDESANIIFSWIEQAQRYSFNYSHSLSYSINAYLSAYAKAHFPKEFFTAYLYYSGNKPKPHEEVKELVNNAKNMDIDIFPPSLESLNINFKLIDDRVCFGLGNIKGLGDAKLTNIQKVFNQQTIGPPESWNWLEFLIHISPQLDKTVSRGLIAAGALRHMGLSRKRMLYEYDMFSLLTKTEQKNLTDSFDKIAWSNLIDIFRYIVRIHPTAKIASNKTRLEKIKGWITLLEHPPHSLTDTAESISGLEKTLMGISITCSPIDDYNVKNATVICRDLLSGYLSGGLILACSIEEVSETETKRGKNPGQKMAFLTVSDGSGMIESIVAFPNIYKDYKELLLPDNNVLLHLKRGERDDSFIILKVYLL